MSNTSKLSFSSISLGQFALGTYILSITLLPLGFGGNRDFPFGLSQIGLAISALALMFEQTIINGCYWPKRIKIALVLFALVLCWGFLQTQSFMPEAWHHPLWQDASKALGTPIQGSIALWRDEAFFSLNRLTTYIIAGLLAYILAGDPARAKLMLEGLWYSGIALCFYGYLNVITGNTKVLWIDKTQYENDLTSTFVSKNHFAIYAVMVMLSGMALLYQSWRNALRNIQAKQMLKAFLRWLQENAFFQVFLILYVFGAIILSHCRSGLILGLIGTATFFIGYQIYSKNWKRALTLAAISFCFSAVIIIIAEQSSEHFAHLFIDQSAGDRLSVYKMCLAAISENPLFGYGLGSFQAVYRLYNHSVTWSFNRAHSDTLESLVDLGVPFGLMLWAAVALLFSGLAHGILTRRRHGLFPALGIAASVVVIAHSSIDFSLQIPGVAMPFAMLLGLALAQSWGNGDKSNA
ncbi:MAG: O-antigen ligase family protein [Alphaproteobacteria bacterium]|nr:O-antigen ligase family protein [Alphaproteobacteria bacterium]